MGCTHIGKWDGMPLDLVVWNFSMDQEKTLNPNVQFLNVKYYYEIGFSWYIFGNLDSNDKNKNNGF